MNNQMRGQSLETQIPEAVHHYWDSSFETVMNSEEQASKQASKQAVCCFSYQNMQR